MRQYEWDDDEFDANESTKWEKKNAPKLANYVKFKPLDYGKALLKIITTIRFFLFQRSLRRRSNSHDNSHIIAFFLPLFTFLLVRAYSFHFSGTLCLGPNDNNVVVAAVRLSPNQEVYNDWAERGNFHHHFMPSDSVIIRHYSFFIASLSLSRVFYWSIHMSLTRWFNKTVVYSGSNTLQWNLPVLFFSRHFFFPVSMPFQTWNCWNPKHRFCQND